MHVKRSTKKYIKQFLNTPVFIPVHRYLSGLCTCLMYHRIIRKQEHPTGYEGSFNLTVQEERFEEQMAFLARHYRCIALPTAINELKRGCLIPGSVIVTFDDGYSDNMRLALPILKKYDIPATVYVTTGFVEGSACIWWYEQRFIINQLGELIFQFEGHDYRWQLTSTAEKQMAILALDDLFKRSTPTQQQALMTLLRAQCPKPYNDREQILNWQQLKMFAKDPLITIGAHTVTHPVMCQLSDTELHDEIGASKKILEQALEQPVLHFAYPFGGVAHASDREYRAVSEAGFDSAMTTVWGHIRKKHSKALMSLPRVDIHYVDTLQDFRWKLNGYQALYAHLCRRVD